MMKRVHYSFDHRDSYKAAQFRKLEVVLNYNLISEEEWAPIREKGEIAVLRWINNHLPRVDCLVVLIGEHTAANEMVQYEIQRAIAHNIPMIGIHINNIRNKDNKTSPEGPSPFVDKPEAFDCPVYRPIATNPLQSINVILTRL